MDKNQCHKTMKRKREDEKGTETNEGQREKTTTESSTCEQCVQVLDHHHGERGGKKKVDKVVKVVDYDRFSMHRLDKFITSKYAPKLLSLKYSFPLFLFD
jgi:hypothetical protein